MAGAGISIRTERLELITVDGRLDDDGMEFLCARVDLLLADGCRLLAADLSGVTACDARVFDQLSRIAGLLEQRAGRLHVLALGPVVLAEIDGATLPDLLVLYRASMRPRARG